MFKKLLREPVREYAIIALLALSFLLLWVWPASRPVLLAASAIGAAPAVYRAFLALFRAKITIDTFNTFALFISYGMGEVRSAAFIALMLSSARLLEWTTGTRTHRAVEELLKLKPDTATVERGARLEEVPADSVKPGDVVVVKSGSRVPVDGVVLAGPAHVNEAPVTGESRLIEKMPGDEAISSSLVDSGVLKIRAVRVGKDSVIERMVALMADAAKHKSKSEKLADVFATVFLPILGLLGLATFLITRDIVKTASLFLVACADDMAVAIPLAMTAAIGTAAKRGVIIKGGEWLSALAKLKILVLDKTGTLTFGNLALGDWKREAWLDDAAFWRYVGIAEKFSEHPVGRTLYREAVKRAGDVPDPARLEVLKGAGVKVLAGSEEIIVGNEKAATEAGLEVPDGQVWTDEHGHVRTSAAVFVGGRYAGRLTVNDQPRPEAAESLRDLAEAGVDRIIMFTGDNRSVAEDVAADLGIREFGASMKPEEKLAEVEKLLKEGAVGMVGDGINDAPALARADVGIAMGGGGTAVAVEAADVIILKDDLSRLPEMVRLGKRTRGVIYGDMAIWLVSNIVGFILVLTGVFGMAFAAFYNFATDFLTPINSSRLFRYAKQNRSKKQ